MTIGQTISNAFTGAEQLTTRQVCERTGLTIRQVTTHLHRMQRQGWVERVGPARIRPVMHRLAGATRTRAVAVADWRAGLDWAVAGPDASEPLVLHARRTQPSSVFDLARCA